MSLLDLAAILLTLSAVFGWINGKFLPFPHTVGLLVMSVAAAGALVAAEFVYPEGHLFEDLTGILRSIDFNAVVMNGMLAFLLFAAALQVDLHELRRRGLQVALLALVGTAISTAVVGAALWAAAGLVGAPLPLVWALVFGALISPTDPVAVMSTLRHVAVPPELEIELKGESLFNDGTGIVLFTLLLRVATDGAGAGAGAEEGGIAASFAELLLREAVVGLALGLTTGYLAYWAVRLIDDYAIEVLITLALVTATYAMAQRIGASGPLAVVAAGLLIGDRGPRDAMTERSKRYVFGLWTLIDVILNSVLFLLIGLEVLILRVRDVSLLLTLLAIPAVLLGRLVAVGTPLLMFPWSRAMSVRNVPFLTWAAIRGGVSVALALSLPASDAKATILSATYAVVLFSIVVQGLTLAAVARRTVAVREGSA